VGEVVPLNNDALNYLIPDVPYSQENVKIAFVDGSVASLVWLNELIARFMDVTISSFRWLEMLAIFRGYPII
jgi:hypothetical protein